MNPRIARPHLELVTLTLCTLACIAALGCTTEPSDDNGGGAGVPAAGAGGAPLAGAGGAGVGGAGGAGGAGGSAGMAAPVMCTGSPGMTCPVVMSANGPLMPCCDTDSGDICGATVGTMGECEGTGQMGMDDPSCATEMSVVMTPLMGCCKADGKCGVRSGTLMGCIERTDYPPTFLMGGMALTAAQCGAAGAGGAGAGGAGAGGAGAGGAGAGGAGAGGSGGTGGTVSAACMTYCTCMETNCTASTFPSSMTCEQFCATGSEAAVSCWNTHCTNAATMGVSHCAHALGDGTVCPAM